ILTSASLFFYFTHTSTTDIYTLSLHDALPICTPVLQTVNPGSGQQGQQNLSVNLTGQFTHFVQGTTTASFGAGISVATLTVNAATTATGVLNIDPAAATGSRKVAMTTGGEAVTVGNGFTVTAGTSINTPPSGLNIALSSPMINEGKEPTVSGTFSDLDTGDTHTVTISWGDGTANTTVNLAAGSSNFSASHLFNDNPASQWGAFGPPSGAFAITVTVADNHSGKATVNTSITVNNVAPVLGGIPKPSPAVLLRSPANLKASFTDAGTLDTHSCT